MYQIKLFIGLGPVATVGHISGAMTYLSYLLPELQVGVGAFKESVLSAAPLLQCVWDVVSQRYGLQVYNTDVWRWKWDAIKVRLRLKELLQKK